jgi:hypothetical protein
MTIRAAAIIATAPEAATAAGPRRSRTGQVNN